MMKKRVQEMLVYRSVRADRAEVNYTPYISCPVRIIEAELVLNTHPHTRTDRRLEVINCGAARDLRYFVESRDINRPTKTDRPTVDLFNHGGSGFDLRERSANGLIRVASSAS